LVVSDISIDEKYVAGADVEVMTSAVWEKMPARPLDGHKGTFGKALICAGQVQYWGAPFLSGLGALRAGAGLVSLAMPSSIRATIAGQLPEATYPPVPDGETLGQESVDFLLANGMGKVKAVLVGPGLGEADEFVWGMIEALTPNPSPEGRGGQALPSLVVDADGLNALARVDRWWEKMPAFSILTPHPGEMARLCGEEIGDTDRVELARKMAQKWGQIVVLKGAYTVVASPDGEVVLSPFANPILGVGGSGDVLAGVIVSLLAQGCAPFVAAQLGVYWHGAVGVYLANERGWNAGILAHEFANALPTIINRISP
jgi:NAD(P)H-hydrate epimerase